MQQMQIQGTEIQIKEYQGKRVVTLKDVDAVHQRKPGTASRNFNQNRNRFIEDIDFFRINVTDNEIRSQFGISPNAGGTVILITETGYLMLVKSFTDDLAWKVQRELVDSYFRARVEPDEQRMQEIIESGVPTVIVATDKLIRCAEIMAGCLDSNRPYAAIVRAQRIAYVKDHQDRTINKIGEKDGETVSEERWEVQEAWDKQNNFLKAQARAQAELSRMIKQYDEMLHANWELATEEQKTRIQSMKAKAQLNDVEETADDGFLEALNSSATEDWNDEETGI